MLRLNVLKMIGLMLLLAIALALPTVLPKADSSIESAALAPWMAGEDPD